MPRTRRRGTGSRPRRRGHAAARQRSARSLIRAFEVAGGRAVAPGLRTILERCLDPDPARRYRRGSELADDLDRWRTNRPLSFAEEPFWRLTVPRWLRRQRRMFAAAALSITVGLVTTVVVWHGSNRALHQNLERIALGKLTRLWDDPNARTYR